MQEIDKNKVQESLDIIISYCKDRKDRQDSCLGCHIRKTYGTKQPEVCKLNMIERPSDLE